MLVIVVLPFVDLPVTAFHRGTAPSAVHAQATNAPLAITIASAFRLADSVPDPRPFLDAVTPDLNPDPNFADLAPIRSRLVDGSEARTGSYEDLQNRP